MPTKVPMVNLLKLHSVSWVLPVLLAWAAISCSSSGGSGNEPKATASLTYVRSLPSTATLALDRDTVRIGEALVISGEGWDGIEGVGLLVHSTGQSTGEAIPAKAYVALEPIKLDDGAFRTEFRVGDELCYVSGRCHRPQPGDRYSVVVSASTGPNSTGSKIKDFMIVGDEQ